MCSWSGNEASWLVLGVRLSAPSLGLRLVSRFRSEAEGS